MWLCFQRLDNRDEAFLAALGRALAIAQNFEMNCRDVVLVVELGRAFEERRYSSLKDARPFAERLLQLMLGPMVAKLSQIGEVSPQELGTLVAAKDARNYLAHEAATLIAAERSEKGFTDRIERFEQEVDAIVKGDNLVSCWTYEVHEQERAPVGISSTYPSAARAWVLEPIGTLWPRSG